MKDKTKKILSVLKDVLITFGFQLLSFVLCLFIQYIFEEDNALIPAIFVLGAFMTSVVTNGYVYGVAAALISVLAVNFAFTFPFFAFDFTIPENIISAIILLIITITTCSLTTKVKKQEAIKAESERERMRANLLRAVSHDLRTPLTTIYGAGSALLERYDDFTAEQCKQMLKSISDDAQWLSRMVDNLLSVTRLDGGNVDIIKINTAVDELVDSVLLKIAKRYPKIKIEVEIPDEFLFVPMDPMLIEQVIINLLENAIEHAKGMTRLCLKVFAISGKVVFEIKDNGCGMPKEKLKNIFSGEMFMTSDSFETESKHAGIGLSVCASIIKAHGGDIKAERPRGGGCVFRFSLNGGEGFDE